MTDWISNAIIYQVNLRALAAREPRNPVEAADETPVETSPLAYLAEHIDRLCRLGVNTFYLMPPYPVGREGRKGLGSPYAIRDFLTVDPEYGTLKELHAFVAAAHGRDCRVILDTTPNHTARDHVWTRSHPDYYLRNDDGTFRHDFDWSDTAKLDYANPGLRKTMIEVYERWFGCLGGDGIDGFRLDMAHMINDRSFWNDCMRHFRERYPDRQLLFLAESYGASNNSDLFTRGINAAYDDDFYKACVYGYAVDIGGQSTVSLSAEAERNADFTEHLRAFRDSGIAGAFENVLRGYETMRSNAESGPWLARYTDNHDEGRGVYRFGKGATRAVMQLVFLSGHCIPFLLTGQEFGAANRPPIHKRLGTCDKGPRVLTQEGTRAAAGIEFEGNLFARTAAERAEWYAFYRELIALRLATPALTRGSFRIVDIGEEAAPPDRTVVALERELDGTTLRCAVNMGEKARTIRDGALRDGSPVYGAMRGETLAPFQGVVVAR
jgi:glycosidase